MATLSLHDNLTQMSQQSSQRHHTALVQLGTLALQSQTMAQLMTHAMTTLTRTLGFERAAVLQMLPDEQTLHMRFAEGWPPGMLSDATFEISEKSPFKATLESRQPIIIPDFETESYFTQSVWGKQEHLRSSVVVVLDSPDRPFGMIMLNDSMPHPCSLNDRDFLMGVVQVLELAIGRIRQQRLTEMQLQLLRHFSVGLRIRAMLNPICLETEQILESGHCAVMLFEQKTHRIRLASGPSLPPELAKELDNIQKGQADEVEDIAKRHGTLACWSTPISLEPGRVVGTFAILHQQDAHPTSFELRVLEIGAQLVAEAVRVDRQYWTTRELMRSRKKLQTQIDARTVELQGVISQLQREVNHRRRFEIMAKDGEERYQDLFDKSNDLIQLLDTEGKIGFVNHAWMRAMGYARDEVRKIPGEDMVHPDCRSMWSGWMRRVKAGECLENVEVRYFTREGKTLIVEGNLDLLHDSTPVIRAIFRDITERKQAEEEREKFVSLVQCSSDPIAMAHQDGQIQFINAAGRELWGLTLTQSVGNLQLQDLYSHATWSTFQAIAMPVIREAGQWQGEGEVLHQITHAPIDVQISAFLVRHPQSSEPLCIATIQRDIRQRKEVNRLKDELIDTVSHELRTPLTSLRGYTELLLSREYDKPQQTRFLNIIHDETQRLNKLINDFLDVRRMESGRHAYEFTSVDMVSLIQEVANLFKQNKPSQQWRVELPSSLPPVYADRDRIWQVLCNLLSNAVKFTPDQGLITLGAHQQGSSVVSWISDNGPGVPKSEQPFLFEKFYRTAISDQHQLQGSGLGLAIVKEIIDAHEGRVWLDSEVGQGSVFFFSLPLVH